MEAEQEMTAEEQSKAAEFAYALLAIDGLIEDVQAGMLSRTELLEMLRPWAVKTLAKRAMILFLPLATAHRDALLRQVLDREMARLEREKEGRAARMIAAPIGRAAAAISR